MIDFFKLLFGKNNREIRSEASVASEEMTVESCSIEKAEQVQEESLHKPLLDKINDFEKVYLSAGTIIYHGSREDSPHTDYEGKNLLGTRKWFSQDLAYAVDYAFYDSHAQLGKPLLWKCKLKYDIECLKGSQFSLVKSSPWGGGFPYKFPDNFHKYARQVQGEQLSYLLVDHFSDEKFFEILVASHENLIEVIEVFVLPDNKGTAKKHALVECV
jgi:hypothetical protein